MPIAFFLGAFGTKIVPLILFYGHWLSRFSYRKVKHTITSSYSVANVHLNPCVGRLCLGAIVDFTVVHCTHKLDAALIYLVSRGFLVFVYSPMGCRHSCNTSAYNTSIRRQIQVNHSVYSRTPHKSQTRSAREISFLERHH